MHQRPKNEIWNYQQIELGFNYRMNDIQAALGLSQMNRLDEYIKIRHKIAEVYDKKFFNLPIKTPWKSSDYYSSYHLYPIRIKEDLNLKTQKEIYKELWKKGIAVNLHYVPVHRQPYYENLGFKKKTFPESEKFHRETISLPMFPTLTNKLQKFVIDTVTKVIKKYE